MKFWLKSRKKVVLLGMIIALILGYYFRGAEHISGKLVGTWQSDNPYATVQTTFHWNGTYETVVNSGTSADAVNPFGNYVLRGHYSDDGGSFHLYGFKRYIRSDGVEVPFKPCTDLGCGGENEVASFDDAENKHGGLYKIERVDWKAGEMVAIEQPLAGYKLKPNSELWTRQ